MLKDVDDKPKEPARKRAERRWRNHDVEKRFREEKAKPAPKDRKEPEIAETIGREKPDGRGSVIRAQTKFAKFIREMMEGHAKRNELLYALALHQQLYRLKRERLRRLEARQRLRDSWGS